MICPMILSQRPALRQNDLPLDDIRPPSAREVI
jgi:hypothetical protein